MILASKYTDLLMAFLAIPAISKKEAERADFLQAWLVDQGLRVARIHNNLIITRGTDPGDAQILLNSHMDTVPAGQGWDSDPFVPVRRAGRITGLGSNDAGASVISLLGAFETLSNSGHADKLVCVISAEEEISGKEGIESVLAELKSLKFAVVGEPTMMQAAVAERGLMVLDALATGISGHAARKEGVNAIYKALLDLKEIQSLRFPEVSTWLPEPSVNVTMIKAGTGHNVIPDSCEYVVDVRSNDKYSNERLYNILLSVCKSELKPRSMRLTSSFLPSGHRVFGILEKLKIETFGSGTLSDMAIIKVPAIKIGPGDSARSHTANEYILESEIKQAIDTYSSLLQEIISSEL